MKNLFVLVFAILQWSLLTPARAQSPELQKSFLTVEEGLSNNEVTSIVQDHDGFIWIGTRGGLNRYDGYEFEIFNQIPGDSNTLVNPSIESLYTDRNGNIWIGTKSGGVSKYNPVTESFTNISSDFRDPGKILPDNRILSFYQDTLGRIWIGTWENGLVAYDENADTSKHYLPGRLVNSIIGTVPGKIWIGTGEGLYEYVERDDTLILRNQGAFFCHKMHFDEKRNVLWIVSGANDGLYRFDLRNYQWENYRIKRKDSGISGGFHVYEKVFLDDNGKLWIGTWGTGFFVFDPETEEFSRYLIYPDNRPVYNKDYDAVLEIFQDRDKNLWLGTNGGGVCMLTPKLEFHTVGLHPEPVKGLENTRIMSVLEDLAGNLWLGTIGSGLTWSPDRQNFYRVPYPKDVEPNRFFIIKYLYLDHSGTVWTGTNTGTYFVRFNGKSPELVNAAQHYGNPDFNWQVVSFLHDGDMLWLGTLHEGLFLMDVKNRYKTLKWLDKNTKEAGDLNSERISYLYRDSRKRTWIGTYNGLHVFNTKDSTIRVMERAYPLKGDFTGNIITCIEEDQTGDLWVGTPNGLNRIMEQEPSFFVVRQYTEKSGLASNFIKAIRHDSDGKIWLSTNYGISRLDPETGEIINYNEKDGVGGKNFTEASSFRNNRGELFFGGTFGLTWFEPGKINILPTTNIPVFTDLRIYNEPVQVNRKFGKRKVLSSSITHTPQLIIPFRYNNFEIQFSALDYRSQGRNNYTYMLENHDEEWHNIGTRRFVNFNNLKPGEYTLKVKSTNSHNVWNEEPVQMAITILPPFWQTWYALLFYILLIVGIVSVIRWNAVKQVRLANSLEMEKIQHEQDQRISEMKFQFFTNISHEFRTPLTLILAPLKEILGHQEHYGLTEETSRKINIVQKNASRLLKLVNQLLYFRKVETGNMKLAARYANLEQFIQEICLPFKELARINEVTFNWHSALRSKHLWFDPEKLEIILNNLISNAFKFSGENGRIGVSLFEEEDEILISITDNGRGIHPAQIKNVFDRFYRVDKSDDYGSSGIGLALVKRMVELHKGTIIVSSEPGVNTEFTVSLPKGDNHLSPDDKIHPSETSKLIIGNEPQMTSLFYGKSRIKPKSDQCILIVEDDSEVREYLENLLEPLYRIKKASDGLEGYKMALELKPDLILSDVMMPGIDGFELCKRIKSNDVLATVPFILLTAKNTDNMILLGTRVGADDYISKPFDPDYLVEKIKNLLARRQQMQKQFSKSVKLDPSGIEITPSDQLFIEKVIDLIEKNLQNAEFNSEFLAGKMHMSASSLYRKMKSLTDLSPAECIRSIRIKRAGQLLADKDRTITDIAFEVGFNDLKHFRTVFQKHFGCSPSEFRERSGIV